MCTISVVSWISVEKDNNKADYLKDSFNAPGKQLFKVG